MSTLPTLNTELEFQTTAKRQEERTKGIQIGKEEIKLSLFTDNLILYLKDAKIYTKKNS
jgi:hypothetical protein